MGEGGAADDVEVRERVLFRVWRVWSGDYFGGAGGEVCEVWGRVRLAEVSVAGVNTLFASTSRSNGGCSDAACVVVFAEITLCTLNRNKRTSSSLVQQASSIKLRCASICSILSM